MERALPPSGPLLPGYLEGLGGKGASRGDQHSPAPPPTRSQQLSEAFLPVRVLASVLQPHTLDSSVSALVL